MKRIWILALILAGCGEAVDTTLARGREEAARAVAMVASARGEVADQAQLAREAGALLMEVQELFTEAGLHYGEEALTLVCGEPPGEAAAWLAQCRERVTELRANLRAQVGKQPEG